MSSNKINFSLLVLLIIISSCTRPKENKNNKKHTRVCLELCAENAVHDKDSSGKNIIHITLVCCKTDSQWGVNVYYKK